MNRLFAAVVALALSASLPAHERTATAHYLANAGVVVTQGETQVAFDPLFRNDFNRYDRVPEHLERALTGGEPPFDSIDAVFISHYHEDHFEPSLLLDWAEAHTSLHVYASVQAIEAILAVRDAEDTVRERLHAISLQPGDPPWQIISGDLLIEVVRIPHAGWPTRMTDVENLAFRVTLSDETTVVHLGDSDDDEAHFFEQAEHWESRHLHLALPPFWFFLGEEGRHVVDEFLDADVTVGVHAPADMPDGALNRPDNLDDRDVFTEPGETRSIPVR